MRIKTEVFLKAIKGDDARTIFCLLLTVFTMTVIFLLILNAIQDNHKKEIEKARKQTEQQIYNFLTR